jgi:starch phosphorylase
MAVCVQDEDGTDNIPTASIPYMEYQKLTMPYNQVTLYRPEFGNHELLWALMGQYLGRDIESIQKSIVQHVEYTLAMTRFNFSNFGCQQAVAYSLRDRMIECFNDTN